MSPLPMLSAVQIATDRVLLRKSRHADRERLIELQTDPEVCAYIGGPRLREAVEQRLDAIGPANVTAAPGLFVIADKATDDLIGTLELKRRAPTCPVMSLKTATNWNWVSCCGATPGARGWRSRLPPPRCAQPQTNSPTSRSSS